VSALAIPANPALAFRRRAVWGAACFAIAAASAPGVACAQTVPGLPLLPPRTLESLAPLTVRIELQPPIADPLSQAIDAYQDLLKEPLQPDVSAALARRLGFLLTVRAQRAGNTTRSADLEAAIRALLSSRDYPVSDKTQDGEVLYQLARLYDLAGRPADSAAALQAMLLQDMGKGAVQSRQAEGAERLGHWHFSRQHYDDAARAFRQMQLLTTDDRKTDQALYMEGWSRLRHGQPQDALSPLLSLLDRRSVPMQEPVPVARWIEAAPADHQALVGDALRALALSLAAAGGQRPLAELVGPPHGRKWRLTLHRTLAEHYAERQNWIPAAEAYQAYAQAEPDSNAAPAMQRLAIQTYEEAGFADRASAERERFVQTYLEVDEDTLKQRPGWRAARTQAQGDLTVLVRIHDVRARQARTEPVFAAAELWYRRWLKANAADEARSRYRMQLADLMVLAGKTEAAIEEYDEVAYGGHQHADAAKAGFEGYRLRRQRAAAAIPSAAPPMRQAATDAALRYAQRYAAAPNAADALYQAGSDEYRSGDLGGTARVSEALLRLGEGVRPLYRFTAQEWLGLYAAGQERYAEAERSFIAALQISGMEASEYPRLNQLRITSIENQARAAVRRDDYEAAAVAFRRAVETAPDTQGAMQYRCELGGTELKGRQWTAAASTMREYRRLHGERGCLVSDYLILAYSQQQAWLDAAVESETWAQAALSADEKAARWLTAAQYADRAVDAGMQGAEALAVRLWEQRANAVDRQPLEFVRAGVRAMALWDRMKDPSRAMAWAKRVYASTDGGKRAPEARIYLAPAALQVGRQLVVDYERVALPEMAQAAIDSKQKALASALNALGIASEHGSVEVAAEARFLAGELHAQQADALLGARWRKNLPAAELVRGQAGRDAVVAEHRRMSAAEHDANRAAMVRQGPNIYTLRSLEMLRAMQPDRYDKTERGQDEGFDDAQ
jgi:hypothetical protein